MKVRITKAGKKSYWYADKIGQEFDVQDTIIDDNFILYIGGVEHWIDKNECEVIPEYGVTLIAEQPNEKLFQAAVAAMQGLMGQSIAGSHNQNTPFLNKERSQFAWDMALTLIMEGKIRGHL